MKSALGAILFLICFLIFSSTVVSAETTTKVMVGSTKGPSGSTTAIQIKVQGVPEPGVGSMQGTITYPIDLLDIKESDIVPTDRDNYLLVAGRVGSGDDASEADLMTGDVEQIGFILVCIARRCKTNGSVFQLNAKVVGDTDDEGEVKIALEKFSTAADPPENITSFETINGTFVVGPKNGGGGTDKCNGPPTASFKFDVSGSTATFSDQSRADGSDCRINSWSWDFGDGKRESIQNPKHTYDRSGCFTVTVTVTDSEGNTRTSNPQTIVIGTTMPTANFDFSPKTNINAGDLVTFTNTSTPASVSPSWDFGDNTKSTDQSPKHVFFKSGSLSVTLTVTNNGCTASKSQSISVAAPNRPLVRIGTNPVGNSTRFGFALPQGVSSGKLLIFNMAGKKVLELNLGGNNGEVSWNPDKELPNGPYYYVAVAKGTSKIGKLVIHR